MLDGRVALVTGVSRRTGIGFGIARRLVRDGASVFVSGWEPHDAEMPWGAEPGGLDAAVAELDPGEGRLAAAPADLEPPDGPRRLVDAAVARFGILDIVVANHARSSGQDLAALTAAELDRCWAVNARATLLLVQALAALDRHGRPGGRAVLFTSGQHLAPMAGELPYSVSKGAIHQMTLSLADATAARGITVNCVNPGPVDTGWATGATHDAIAARFPGGRWGSPDDVANLVGWLVSDDAAWITGQILNSEGGFRRH
jgi:3-oxoacyl-[acyl-carrier protein] reductase